MVLLENRKLVGIGDQWPIKRSEGGFLGLILGLGLTLLGSIGLALTAPHVLTPPGLIGLLLGVLLVGGGVALLVAAAGYFRLRYELGSDRLLVHSVGATEVVRYDQIDGIYAGQRVGQIRQVRGLNWPGYYVGVVRSRALGLLRVYCTDRHPDSLSVIVTPERTLVLTPSDPAAFRRELIRRIEASEGPSDGRAAGQRGSTWLIPRPIAAGLAAASAALILAAMAVLNELAHLLPPEVALQLDPLGPPGIGSARASLALLPSLALGMLALNVLISLAVRRRESGATTLLLGTSVVSSALVLLAVFRALP